jgi:DNA mismatch repair protein MutS
LAHLEHLEVFQASDFLQIDPDSARSLELLANTRDGGKGSSLYGILDVTKTTAGSRLLENWLRFPLLVPTEIEVRQVLIESLVMDSSLLRYVRKGLSGVLDLDRLASRLALDKASARDLLGLEASLARVLELATLWDEQPSGKLLTLEFGLESRSALSGVVSKIAVELSRDPSPVLTEGGLIKEGVSAELDELRHLRLHSQEILQAYLGEEKAKTGLSQLKLKQNRIIGYYFEVSKARLERLPEHFQRRQSLIGSERYSTERLRELEDRLQHAEERIFSLERELFWALRDHVKVLLTPIQRAAAFSARLDVVSSLAQVALDRNWVRPLVTESLDLVLEDARHPVVEANSQEPFVPNSVHFSAADSLVLITGPNMAGKSTYLRQTALIVLLAQTGSFVPCRRAEVGITDRIFCRVGASDHLSRGESTFLVEMHETARILRSATPQSLVIMDEVGRGTSTRDGFSLAWAICEYLLDTVRAKTLFATHFHELTALSHPALRNFSMAVEDDGREVVFLRKVVKGASDNSYGLHVARLAGVPARVVDRAAHILESLEPEHTLPREQTRAGTATNRRSQLDLFVPEPQPDLLREELRRLDPDNLTPFQALQLLAKWKALSVE